MKTDVNLVNLAEKIRKGKIDEKEAIKNLPINQKVSVLRLARNWSIAELERRVDLKLNVIWYVEKKGKFPRSETILKLANAFKVKPGLLSSKPPMTKAQREKFILENRSKMTVEEMAQALGVCQGTIYLMLKGVSQKPDTSAPYKNLYEDIKEGMDIYAKEVAFYRHIIKQRALIFNDLYQFEERLRSAKKIFRTALRAIRGKEKTGGLTETLNEYISQIDDFLKRVKASVKVQRTKENQQPQELVEFAEEEQLVK